MGSQSNVFVVFPFSSVFGVLTILNIVFCVVAALKASEGVLWRYPFSISFIELIGEDEIDSEIKKGKREVSRAFKEIKEEFEK